MNRPTTRRLTPATALFAAAVSLFAPGCEAQTEKTAPSGVVEMFRDQLETPTGDAFDSAALKDKVVLLYFSAAWCGPCKIITPIVKRIEEEARKKDQGAAVVLVNLDFSDEEKAAYLQDNELNWPSIKGTQNESIQKISNQYKARRLPTLIVLSPTGDVITKNGVEDLRSDPDGALAKWKTRMQTASPAKSSPAAAE